MSSIVISTPPTGQPIGNDSWDARQKINISIGNLQVALQQLQALVGDTAANSALVNGNLSFGNISEGILQGNLKTELLQGTSPATANTGFTLTHTLGKIPNGALLIQSNVAAILYGDMTDQSWTNTTITLLLNQASVNYVILVL